MILDEVVDEMPGPQGGMGLTGNPNPGGGSKKRPTQQDVIPVIPGKRIKKGWQRLCPYFFKDVNEDKVPTALQVPFPRITYTDVRPQPLPLEKRYLQYLQSCHRRWHRC